MADVSSFESREARIDREIQDGVDAIRGQARIALPKRDAGIVASYLQKIQGACDADRAKKDTETAIDLLYIAYNAIPQREGEIRVKITGLMNRLIALQQKSQLTMQNAMQVATGIARQLDDVFPDWLDAKEAGNRAEIDRFFAKDLQGLGKSIATKAISIRDQLLAIASSYDGILGEAEDAAAKGKAALSARLADRRATEKEMDEAGAKREQLGSLVEGLKAQVADFEREARDHGLRAGTAEQRALARAVPAAARAAGFAGVLVSSILRPPAASAGAVEDGARQRGGAKPEDGASAEATGGAAPGLRDAQLRLIETIESYEKERLGQSAALARVAALLDGKRTEEQTIQLALKCLDVSLDALGRLKEIAEEVAALSAALSDSGIGELDDVRAPAETGEDPADRAGRLDAEVDAFFIRQAARWHAVAIVSDGFNKLFAEGWSKLNTLSGTYVTGDTLDAYLKGASVKLTAIVAERKAAAARKVASLQAHRDTLTRDA